MAYTVNLYAHHFINVQSIIVRQQQQQHNHQPKLHYTTFSLIENIKFSIEYHQN